MNTKTFSYKFLSTVFAFALVLGAFALVQSVSAQSVDPNPSLYGAPTYSQALPYYSGYGGGNDAFYQQIAQFLAFLNGGNTTYFPGFTYTTNPTPTTTNSNSSSSSNNNFDEPDVETDDADDVERYEAELNGEVDMNDFEDGLVFFVYGEDEDDVDDVEDEDEYKDIDEDGDDLQKVKADSSFDGDDDFSEDIDGLDKNTKHYFRICVEYEDEDGDEELECGDVEDFRTDS